jgi:hypothetical protein
MPPRPNSNKKWHSVGYFQDIYCSEKSKEKAKQLVQDYYAANEPKPNNNQFKIEHSVWLRGIKSRDQLVSSHGKLTEEMFEKRNQIGLWFIGEKDYYVSEEDCGASFYNE